MAPVDKTFDVVLVVRPVGSEDFFLGSDTPRVEVDQGDVAEFSVLLTGTYSGLIVLTADNVPENAVITFDPAEPASVGDTVWMLVQTEAMAAGEFTVTMRAAAAV